MTTEAMISPYVVDPDNFPPSFLPKDPIVLDLEAVDDDVYQSTPRKFSTRKHTMHKGFVLGHAVQAVNNHIGDELSVNSVHGVFVGSVSHKHPIVYYLERLQNDQNSCVARNVEGRQAGRIVFSGIASLSKNSDKPNENFDQSARRTMSSIPTPESLTNLQDAYEKSIYSTQSGVHMPKEFEKALERLTGLWTENNVEFRPIDQQCWLKPGNQNKEMVRFWIRCKSSFDNNSKEAALGFLSGLCAEAMPGQQNATMSQQTLWFNQVDFKPNQWIYCELSALQQAKKFADFLMCKFWNREGEILASAVQEVGLGPRARV